MAPSRNIVLALLGLVASIQAIPAAIPEPDAQVEESEDPFPSPTNIISLSPPTYSISWDGPQPPRTTRKPWPWWPPSRTSTDGHVSASISWDKNEEKRQWSTNIISLNPPSYSISWDGPQPPKTTSTKKPWTPKPTKKTSTKGHVSTTSDCDKREAQPTDIISLDPPSYSVSWDGPLPPKTTRKPWPWWPPAYTSTNGYVSASVSWGKRQEDEEPEPTDVISLNPPSYSVSWDGPLPPKPTTTKKPWPWWPPARTSTNGYVSASISWNKRQEDSDPEPTDVPAPSNPDFPEDPEDPVAPLPTSANSIGIQPPRASLSWGKRQDDNTPTEVFPPAPTPTDQISAVQPSATISWGRRAAETQVPSYGLAFPSLSVGWPFPPKSTAWISWGKREAQGGHHSTFLTHATRPAGTPSVACPTFTQTVVPPCVPPACPRGLVSCRVGDAVQVEVRQIEKRVLTVTTVAGPSATSAMCKPVTVTVDVGCPTWTCVPGGGCL